MVTLLKACTRHLPCTEMHFHTAALIYKVSTRLLHYSFLRGPPQSLMLQLISKAEMKRLCSHDSRLLFPQTIVALRQSRPGCPLSPGHCGAAVGAHYVPPIAVRQQTPLSTTTTLTAGEKARKTHWREWECICILCKPSRDSISKC